jgi:hypothetical protein
MKIRKSLGLKLGVLVMLMGDSMGERRDKISRIVNDNGDRNFCATSQPDITGTK